MNIPTHTSNVTKDLSFLMGISFKYLTIFFNWYTPNIGEEMVEVYLIIIKFIAIIEEPITK